MGIKRIVDTSFWTDGKVDEFTPEDKYFMLYLLTNPFSTQLGIYEISIKQAAFQLGYSADAFRALLDRFENQHKIIMFSRETNEIAIKNYLRHSIVKGGIPVRDLLIRELRKVKNPALISFVFSHIKSYGNINETVKGIIAEYESKNGELRYSHDGRNAHPPVYQNDNDNDNDNDVSYHDSYNDSFNESSNDTYNDSFQNEEETLPDAGEDNKQDASKGRKRLALSVSELKSLFKSYTDDQAVIPLLLEWCEIRKAKKSVNTETAIRANLKKLQDMANQSSLTIENYLEEIISRSWIAFYPIRSSANGNSGKFGSSAQSYQFPPLQIPMRVFDSSKDDL